ncbi:carbamoyl-phosphate synthase L chain, ATP binding domain-containing protein [Xylariaceae sp. FL0255]|nr:carbamoyl-phosphate synthase L chain, ATP binding domain-containing protein [Xylariaceae sp. FL0255]
MDEAGAQEGEGEGAKVIGTSRSRRARLARGEGTDWVTFIEYICLDGTVGSPMVIFSGKTPQAQHFPRNNVPEWLYTYTKKGWSRLSNETGAEAPIDEAPLPDILPLEPAEMVVTTPRKAKDLYNQSRAVAVVEGDLIRGQRLLVNKASKSIALLAAELARERAKIAHLEAEIQKHEPDKRQNIERNPNNVFVNLREIREAQDKREKRIRPMRGEIAKRIIDAARELSIETCALVTPGDTGHALGATRLIPLTSPASFLDIPALVKLAREEKIDAVHPGYGFLSESPEFSRQMWEDARAIVIGPGFEILKKTGDKLAAKALAYACDVPTLPAMKTPTASLQDIEQFAAEVGFPIMLKAVDGGGGKGIRLVRTQSELQDAARRAISESPSRQIFAEKAAVEGFRHIEVQIIGDGSGEVRHVWERECSVQRKFQKVIEQAPSNISDRKFAGAIINASVRMARNINYLSLGTFEFLANAESNEFFFLEINPRLQVEHTVTEAISHIDLVKIQLNIAQGAKLAETGLQGIPQDMMHTPKLRAIQLRLTAENVQRDWSLSIGRIQSFSLPAGHGIRVDTHLNTNRTTVVGTDFDSLLAKIIVVGDQKETVSKCRRALEDTCVVGVNTNLDILRAIVHSEDFNRNAYDTLWLENNLDSLLTSGMAISRRITEKQGTKSPFAADNVNQPSPVSLSGGSSTVLLRKGDAWAIRLTDSVSTPQQIHHLKLDRIIRNDLPSSLQAEIEYAAPGFPNPQKFKLEATSTTASSTSIMAEGKHRRGDISNPLHVVIPFPGKLVEVVVDEGNVVRPGQVICVVQQMKMELEIRANRSGRVIWITEAEDGEDVAENTLAAELESCEDDVVEKPRL